MTNRLEANLQDGHLAAFDTTPTGTLAVALGLPHAGRVVTAATVLLDGTLVRLVLLPAFMHVMGGPTGGHQRRSRICTQWMGMHEAPCVRPLKPHTSRPEANLSPISARAAQP
jgi:hypothetical protein